MQVGPSQIWTNGLVEDDVIHDVKVLRARVSRAARASVGYPCRRVKLKAAPPNPFGGVWRHVPRVLGLKFLRFVDPRP